MPSALQRRLVPWLSIVALCAATAQAQTAEPTPAPSPAPAPVPTPTPTPASAPASAPQQRIEISGGRGSDADQRRQSTAAKIVIGRDEIERFGDSNTLEVLKRLPGVTIPGAPGRGGAPRLRGMGAGFTQILIDGDRIGPGFSLDAIPPDQIERIEILRAPTAETGARAIAGTINIVMREGYRKKVNDLNLGVNSEAGRTSGGLTWTRNDAFGEWIANTSLSLFRNTLVNESATTRTDIETAGGSTVLQREGRTRGQTERSGLHFGARLQWRGDGGESFLLSPMLVASDSKTHTRGTLADTIASITPLEYAGSDTDASNRFSLQRLNLNYNHRLGSNGPRLEWRGGLSVNRSDGRSARREFDSGGALLRPIDERSDSRDRGGTLGLKASQLVGDSHQLVGGIEFERNRRDDSRSTLISGVPQLTEFGANLQASSRRYAAYGQDEWTINPQWAAHAGLRLEGIRTEGEGAAGVIDVNNSRVATPLLHAVWKPDEKSQDRVRASLTRSYRAPNLSQLIGRPSVSRTDPAPGANSELTADAAGNPRLKPEVALGIDLAVERYLAEGGVLSANVFVRRIDDLIRTVVGLEDVSWAPGTPRYVARPSNIGKAVTRGIELEAKFRLEQLIDGGPPTELRANAALFRSRVEAVPGPDNRLAEQPGGTLNFGVDHRFRALPLTIGGNLNHTPGYRTRLEADRAIVQSEKNVLDAYALWTVSPELKLRLSLSNALAPDSTSTSIVQSGALLQTNATTTRSFVNAQLRLEMKL
jgi:outer membrane receptor for ferrienterochelin and colicins